MSVSPAPKGKEFLDEAEASWPGPSSERSHPSTVFHVTAGRIIDPASEIMKGVTNLMMKRGTVFVSVVVAAACVQCGSYDLLILRPSAAVRRKPADLGYQFVEKTITSRSGAPMSIWHVATTVPPRKGIIVVIPGNDANKGRYITALPIFADDGWDVVLPDYIGFGESPGEATLAGLVDSAFGAVDYALGEDPIVVGLGVSLGTPVLARVAAERDLTAALFESTTVLLEAAQLFLERHNIDLPVGGLADAVSAASAGGDYDMKRWIRDVHCPKLFIHSPDDNVTPFAGALEVFAEAPQPKHMFVTQGEHALQVFIDPNLYRSVLNGYLDGVLNRDPIENELFRQILQEEIDIAFEALGFEPPPVSAFAGFEE